jgi:hypothetical protein
MRRIIASAALRDGTKRDPAGGHGAHLADQRCVRETYSGWPEIRKHPALPAAWHGRAH